MGSAYTGLGLGLKASTNYQGSVQIIHKDGTCDVLLVCLGVGAGNEIKEVLASYMLNLENKQRARREGSSFNFDEGDCWLLRRLKGAVEMIGGGAKMVQASLLVDDQRHCSLEMMPSTIEGAKYSSNSTLLLFSLLLLFFFLLGRVSTRLG